MFSNRGIARAGLGGRNLDLMSPRTCEEACGGSRVYGRDCSETVVQRSQELRSWSVLWAGIMEFWLLDGFQLKSDLI